MRLNTSLSAAATFVFLLASIATAQSVGGVPDPLRAVRELYASAAYEDALAAVGKLEPAGADLEAAAEYRVFCLVALGRMDEAGQAVEAVLMARPEYKPDPAEASPRIQALFSDVRQRIAPGLVKRMYQQGRAAMERKDREEAVGRFEAMIRLADAPEIRGDATVKELKELGSGFLELSRSIPANAAPVAEAPAPAATAARTHVIVPPAVIQQRLPRWIPAMGSRPTSDFQGAGAVRVQISADGKVVAAEIIKSIHPAYDQLLLRAARGWTYEPARKDGVPIAIDKTVEVKVAPSTNAEGAADKSLPF